LTYVTKSSPSVSSIFYNDATTIPANNTTANIYRSGRISVIGTTNPLLNLRNTVATGQTLSHHFDNASSAAITIGVNNASYVTTTDYGNAGDTFLRNNGGTKNLNIINNSTTNGSIKFFTSLSAGVPTERISISASGDTNFVKNVTANAIDTNTTKITITTSVSITTATLDANGIRQDGRHVVIDNGVNVINLTCNGGVTASYGKTGTGAITFVQGSGRTLVQLSGTAVFNGIAGSTATLWSNGTTDYLAINNY